MSTDVDDFLMHFGVKGMKWGVTRSQASLDRASGRAEKKAAKKEAKANKTPSAGKQRDMEIKAARSRLNEGKNFLGRAMNADSFGKPLGGRQMLSLMNPGKSEADIAMAAKMTRGQKAALGVVAGLAVTGQILRLAK